MRTKSSVVNHAPMSLPERTDPKTGQTNQDEGLNPYYLLSREKDDTASRLSGHTCCTRSSGPWTPRKTTYPKISEKKIIPHPEHPLHLR